LFNPFSFCVPPPVPPPNPSCDEDGSLTASLILFGGLSPFPQRKSLTQLSFLLSSLGYLITPSLRLVFLHGEKPSLPRTIAPLPGTEVRNLLVSAILSLYVLQWKGFPRCVLSPFSAGFFAICLLLLNYPLGIPFSPPIFLFFLKSWVWNAFSLPPLATFFHRDRDPRIVVIVESPNAFFFLALKAGLVFLFFCLPFSLRIFLSPSPVQTLPTQLNVFLPFFLFTRFPSTGRSVPWPFLRDDHRLPSPPVRASTRFSSDYRFALLFQALLAPQFSLVSFLWPQYFFFSYPFLFSPPFFLCFVERYERQRFIFNLADPLPLFAGPFHTLEIVFPFFPPGVSTF